MNKDISCYECKYFIEEECSIDIDSDDYEKCMKRLPDGSYEFCPLYGGYPKEKGDA